MNKENQTKQKVGPKVIRNGQQRPRRPDSFCGKVWTQMDIMTAKLGRPVTRKEILVWALDNYGVPAKQLSKLITLHDTVAGQFGYWRKFSGLKGRAKRASKAAISRAVKPKPVAKKVTEKAKGKVTAPKTSKKAPASKPSVKKMVSKATVVKVSTAPKAPAKPTAPKLPTPPVQVPVVADETQS